MSYLGIDIGTFESKGALVDEGGAILATARRPHRMQVPRPGWAEHDAEADWWGDLVAICRELLAQEPAGSVRALACSAIGPCMLPVDEAGTPLTNAVLYGVDGRATTEVEELTATIGVERLLARTGNALTSQSVGPKILWLRRNRPEVWARTARLHTSTSFLVERLTGESVIDHYSAAGFGPLYDVERREWSAELADILPLRMLPRLGWSAEIAGRISERAAAATGLPAGTPVAFGTIDAAAEALSVGVRERGRHDADVRVDRLHHRADRRPDLRCPALVRSLALPRACMRRWRASRHRARSRTGSATSWRGTCRTPPSSGWRPRRRRCRRAPTG